MSEDDIIFEKDNGAWIPRYYLPCLDKGKNVGLFGGSLKLTKKYIIFTGRNSKEDLTISIKYITNYYPVELGIGRDVSGTIGGISIDYTDQLGYSNFLFKVGDQKKWLTEIGKIWNLTDIQLEKKAKQFESVAKTINNYEECIEIWERIGKHEEATRVKEIIKNKIEKAKKHENLVEFEKAVIVYKQLGIDEEVIRVRKLQAKNHEKLMEFDEAAEIYKQLGIDEEVIRVRKLKAEQGAVKVDQTVVQGDQITKTEIKDSVLNRSNVGGGNSKMQELKDLTEMKEKGLIDDDEFKQMKKEILGK